MNAFLRWVRGLFRKRTPVVPVPLPPAKDVPPDPPHEIVTEEPEPEPPPIVGPASNDPGYPKLFTSACDVLQPEWTPLWNEAGLVTVEKPGIIQLKFPKGFVPGTAPGTLYRPLVRPVQQIYVRCRLKFSENWQGHQDSGVSKILHLFRGGSKTFIALFGPENGPFELRMMPEFPWSGEPATRSKVTADPLRLDQYGQDAYQRHGWLLPNVDPRPVPIGEWFLLEIAIVALRPVSLTRWWMNGVLQGRYWGITYPPDGFDSLKVSPTFGGVGGASKRHDDFIWLDDVFIGGQ